MAAERLTIAKENGENLSVEFVSCFTVPDLQKQFLITTSNEIDPNGLVVLNVSEIQNNKLLKIQSDDDWSKIKQVMRSIISSSDGEFKYQPLFDTATAEIDYARNISVQSVAKDQLIKDYYDKKPIGGSTSSTTVPDEPVVDIPMNPALGNVPVTGGNEVAPGIVEVGNNAAAASTIVQPVVNNQPINQPMNTVVPVTGMQQMGNVQPQQMSLPMGVNVQPPMNNLGSYGQSTVGSQNMGINFDQVVNEAKEVFLESARNLAEVIVANAFESIRKKEEELRNREVVVAQREAAINQQTMMSMNQMPYNQVPVSGYPDSNNQTQV